MDFGEFLCNDKITVAEFVAVFVYLINSNVPFEITFTPRNKLEFATLELTIWLNPRINTSIEVTLTDR